MQEPAVQAVIIPRAHDLGGFEVRRALPSQQRQMIGPFIFFDQIGPGEFLTGRGLDVRPHPHIGLATVTYLFDGAILHRDSLGTEQSITPGDVNWMTAGQGIAHSERTDAAERVHSNVIAHPTCEQTTPFGLAASAARRSSRTDRPFALAVLTTVRNAA